jgi:sigma-B regulation protein RsbU (phosphoserine phosphatase)
MRCAFSGARYAIDRTRTVVGGLSLWQREYGARLGGGMLGDILDGLGLLLDPAHCDGPHRLGPAVMAAAPQLDAAEIVVYLVDYAQTTLTPLGGPGVPHRDALPIDGTLAGRAYAATQVCETSAEAPPRIWLPLLDGAQRLGVVEIVPKDHANRATFAAVAALLGQLVSTRRWYGDAIEHIRRRLPMQVATETVWGLLPPLTLATEDVVVAGILEPCYEVGGDVFDYAVNPDVTHVALFDAVGHGITASMLSTLAVNAYRNARRCGLNLVDTYRSIDKWVRACYPDSFLTAILAELDPATGRYRRICAGHPGELLLRNGKLVRVLPGPTALPLGMDDLGGSLPADLRRPEVQAPGIYQPVVTEEPLEPGDHLLLYTDGVIEARSEAGEFFGVERLAGFLVRALADQYRPAETMRRLIHAILDHQHEQLQDDATAVCVHWSGGVTARSPGYP